MLMIRTRRRDNDEYYFEWCSRCRRRTEHDRCTCQCANCGER